MAEAQQALLAIQIAVVNALNDLDAERPVVVLGRAAFDALDVEDRERAGVGIGLNPGADALAELCQLCVNQLQLTRVTRPDAQAVVCTEPVPAHDDQPAAVHVLLLS